MVSSIALLMRGSLVRVQAGAQHGLIAQLVEHGTENPAAQVRFLLSPQRDSSSIGRAPSFQVGGCEFDPRLSLKFVYIRRAGWRSWYLGRLIIFRSRVRVPFLQHIALHARGPAIKRGAFCCNIATCNKYLILYEKFTLPFPGCMPCIHFM